MFLQVLHFVREAMESGIPADAEEGTIDTPAVRTLLKEAATAGVVLLKNEQAVLPIKATKGLKIAVIGPNAAEARICESPILRNVRLTVSPLLNIPFSNDSRRRKC